MKLFFCLAAFPLLDGNGVFAQKNNLRQSIAEMDKSAEQKHKILQLGDGGRASSNRNVLTAGTPASRTGDLDRHLQVYDGMYYSGYACAEYEFLVAVEVLADWYGNETTWEIVRNSDNATVLGGFQLASAQSSWTSACLPKNCYTFTIRDSKGDGICCDYGLGKYSVWTGTGSEVDSEVTMIKSGGSFRSSESVTFGGTCQSASTYQKTKCANVTVSLWTDDTPWETYVSLYDLNPPSANYYGWGTNYFMDQYFEEPNKKYTLTQCIPPTHCFEVAITAYGPMDDYGDGIVGKNYTVKYNNTIVGSGNNRPKPATYLVGGACAGRPPCKNLTFSITTPSNHEPNSTVLSLTDMLTYSTYWSDTLTEDPSRTYEWKKCIDPLRCYDLSVSSVEYFEDGSGWYGTGASWADLDAVLTLGGIVIDTTNVTSSYYIGDACEAFGYQSY